MTLLSAIILGLTGALHCVGMCGPLVATMGGRDNLGRVLYQAGRVLTYSILGFIVGFGATAAALASTSRMVSIIAGCLMVTAAVFQIVSRKALIPSGPILKATAPLRELMQRLRNENSSLATFGMGMLNGLLPCGLVLVALFGAASTVSAYSGALYMLLFGTATVPALAAVLVGSRLIGQTMRTRFSAFAPVVTVAIGIVLVVRGMALGIPYVSPAEPKTFKDTTCCAHVRPSTFETTK